MPRKNWTRLDVPTNVFSDSDFPTLSGGPRQAAPSNAAIAGWNSAAIRQTAVQQQPQQQSQQSQPQQQQQQQQRAPSVAPSQQSIDQFDGQRSSVPSDHRGASGADDFPPLGGQVNGDTLGQSNGFGSSIASPDIAQPSRAPNGQQTELSIRQASNAAFQQPSQQAPIGSSQGAPQQAQQAQQQHAPATQSSQLQMQPAVQNGQPHPKQSTTSTTLPPGVKRYADMSDNEKYGLAALVAAFEARRTLESGGQPDQTLPPAMRHSVFLGQDLNSLGLDLDSPDPLYTTFTPFPSLAAANGGSSGQFDFHDRHMVPDFTLPSAYTVTNVPPLSSRMSAFSDETLFSIFYQNPRDLLQELASIELTARDWRWHKVLRQWLQKDTHLSAAGGGGGGASALAAAGNAGGGGGGGGSSLPIVDLAGAAFPAVRMGANVERGVYVFFDAGNWRRERREFVLDYGELDNRHAGGGMGGPPATAVPAGGNHGGAVAAAMGGSASAGMGVNGGVPSAPPAGLVGGGQQQAVQAPTPAPGLPAPPGMGGVGGALGGGGAAAGGSAAGGQMGPSV
ncbi:hypothetical protein LTR36_004545 [Oleoguttula mirabilis]|uniref:NOT2/NOT3/NOT5 C-terminal domain-containing protein n=1 Tax=Oleoguttula mirabilis TaxID=1507867 RepID=A0AAV9JG84_9PEZI|nr:hypothetical protein LTR36_004545 [Oleoguttula mirabilis]